LPATELVKSMVTLRLVLASYRRVEQAFGVVALLAFVGPALVCLWRWTPRGLRDARNGWLACVLAAIVLYLVVPDAIGSGTGISARILVFALFALALWLAQFPLPRRTAAAMVAGSLLATAGLTAAHLGSYKDFNRELRAYTSVRSQLPKGATVVPVFFADSAGDDPGLASSVWVRPVLQATGYLMADRRVVDLSHYQGQFDYFITRFRPCVDPLRTIGRGREWIADVPPDVDLLRYTERTGGVGHIDYVLVWGRAVASRAALTSRPGRSLLAQLRSGYDLVYRSPGRGLAELYRSRSAASVERRRDRCPLS
jgi:hypothetical protein